MLLLIALQFCTAYAKTFKILQINSYSSDWIWIKNQHDGFLQGLGNVQAEFRTVDLDSKNKDSIQINAMALEATKQIENWHPDLLFVTDDFAQSAVTSNCLNGETPIVFSAVNKDPAAYGFDTAKNVAGVLELEHFIPTITLLKEIVKKNTLRLAIVIDDDPTWNGVVKRIKSEIVSDTSVKIVSLLQPKTFIEFKNSITEIQEKVDAVGMLGVFRFIAADGKFVDYETVLRWTAENSRLPDFSFWDTRVERGTLCAVTVSGVEQGRIAGSMAREILVNKKEPSGIQFQSSKKGHPMISLARARKLGITINTKILLNAQVLPNFIWDKK